MTTFITGATRGIGREILLQRPSDERVVGVYRQSHEAARALTEQRPHAELIACDVTSPEAVAALIGALTGRQQQRLVLSAGITHTGSFVRAPALQREPDPLLNELRSNLEAPLYLLRALLEAELVADGASVVVVSSNLVRHALFGKVAYAAAKAGLEAAVRQLCVELGPRGVRINAVAPGLIRTDMTRGQGAAALEAYASEAPLGRVGEAADVASVVGFFLSPSAGYITGQVLDVDGGWGAR